MLEKAENSEPSDSVTPEEAINDPFALKFLNLKDEYSESDLEERKNNRGRRYEDGRKLRRYKRRWIMERTHAWLGQFRRLLVRHEHLLSTYRAFFYLACFWITLRHCL
jgi:hypothetical protein